MSDTAREIAAGIAHCTCFNQGQGDQYGHAMNCWVEMRDEIAAALTTAVEREREATMRAAEEAICASLLSSADVRKVRLAVRAAIHARGEKP